MPLFRGPGISERIEFLSRPEIYPDSPDSVTLIETHFAFVFLSRKFAYKLKKPIRLPGTDLRTVHARKANCELELALNRRLAGDTYVGVVPLGRRGSELRLECDTRPVDWLVKMLRLPGESSLEVLLQRIGPSDHRLSDLIQILCAFYGQTVRAPWSAENYSRRLKRQSRKTEKGFDRLGLDAYRLRSREISSNQRLFVDRHFDLLARRVAEGRIRDVHGDLRPEHIFLVDRPQVIDCLEFSSDLRQLDTAEEMSFLRLECDRLDHPEIGERLWHLYMETNHDDVSPLLRDYYRSRRAFTRAYVSAWHLNEDLDENAARRWKNQTEWYVEAAAASVSRALSAAETITS